MSLGMGELVVVFVIALLIFGPRKLPEIAKSLGKAMRMFRDASNEMKRTLEEDIRLEEDKTRKTPNYSLPPSLPEETATDDEFMEDYEEIDEEPNEEPVPESEPEKNAESPDIYPETESTEDLPG